MALTQVEQQKRAQCLSDAIRSHGGTGTPGSDIVKIASQYLAFVEGRKEPPPKKVGKSR